MAQTRRKRTKRKTRKTGGVNFRTLATLPSLLTAKRKRERERKEQEELKQERKNFSDLIPTDLPKAGVLYFKVLFDCRNLLKELYNGCNKNKNTIDENILPIKEQINIYIKKLRICKNNNYHKVTNIIKTYLLSNEYTKNIVRLKIIEIDKMNQKEISSNDLKEYERLKKEKTENDIKDLLYTDPEIKAKQKEANVLKKQRNIKPLSEMKQEGISVNELEQLINKAKKGPRYNPLAPNSLTN